MIFFPFCYTYLSTKDFRQFWIHLLSNLYFLLSQYPHYCVRRLLWNINWWLLSPGLPFGHSPPFGVLNLFCFNSGKNGPSWVFSWLGARNLWEKERTQGQRQHLRLGRVRYPSGWDQGPWTEEETGELRRHCIAGSVLCPQNWTRTSGLGVRKRDERNVLETVLVSLVIVRWNFIQRGSVDFIWPPAGTAALIISSNLWTKFGKT